MPKILMRLFVYAVAIAIVAAILPGIHVKNNDIGTLAIVAIIFGLINAVVKPIVQIMSCPLIVLTFGLFALVINGLMLLLTDALAGGRFTVDGFWWAVLGGIILGFVAGILEGALGLKDNKEDDEGPIIIRS